jgi:23S rRNA (adenine-N6)-dimethyltransferase
VLDLKYTQNFINNPELLKELVDKTKLNANSTVLDIGAGKGSITKVLAEKCAKVIAYEQDTYVAGILRSNVGDNPKVTIIESDFTRERLPKEPYSVFSNIPFNKTSAIINKLLFSNFPPDQAYFFVQKEAALRYMGFGEGKLISLLLEPVFNVKIVHGFDKKDFEPAPSVNVVMIAFEKKRRPDIDEFNIGKYADFVSFVLTQQKPSLFYRTNKIFTPEQFKRLSKDLGFDLDIIAKAVPYEIWKKLFEYYLVGVDEKKKALTAGAFAKYISTKDNQKKSHRTKIRLPRPSPSKV